MAATAELSILIQARDMASKQIDGVGKSLGGLGGVGKAAAAGIAGVATVTAAAGVAIVGGLGASISAASDFQAVISKVGAVSGATAPQLDMLSQLALKMGADTAFSAGEAAQAMAALAAGGIQVADMANVLPGVLDLAAAGGLGLAQAADIATSTLSIFSAQGATMTQVANAFAGAANISSISVADMGEAMKYVGPVANSLGLSLEDTSAALALLGANGLKGSEAGTGLRTVLASLAGPSDKAKALMSELGINMFDASGKMKDMAGISDELKNALAGMSDQQKIATLQTLFGKEGMSAALAIMGEGENSIQSYTKRLAEAATANATGKKMMDNFKGSMDALKGSVETAAITLGLALLPALRKVVDGATGAVNAAVPFIQAWGPKLAAALGAGITALVSFGTKVGSAIGAVIGAFQALTSGKINFGQFIGGIELMVAAVREKLGGLAAQVGPPLAAFFSAIGTFIAGVAPQIAAQMGLWAQAFVGWVESTAIPWLVPKLQALLSAIGTWVTGTALPAITAFLVTVGQAFGTWVTTTAVPFLQANLPVWLSALGSWLSGTALPAVGAFLAMVGEKFGTWVSETAVPFLQANIPIWLAALGDWITGTAAPAVGGFLGELASKFGTWVSESAIPYLQQNIPQWLAALGSWITGTAAPAVGGFLGSLAEKFGTWVSESAIPWVQSELPKWQESVRGWILGTALPAIVATLHDVALAFGNWIIDTAVPWLLAKIPVWLAALGGWILGTAIPAIVGFMLKVGEEFGNFITTKAVPFVTQKLPEWQHAVSTWIVGTAIPAIVATLLKVGEKFGDFITEKAVPYLKEKIPQWLAAIRDYLTGTALPAIGDKAKEIGTALVEKFMAEAQKLKDKVFAEMALVPGKIKAGIGDLGTLLFNAGAALVQGLIDGIRSKIGALIGALGELTNLIPKEKGPPARDAVLLFDNGRLITQGLIDGIQSQRPQLTSALQDLGGAIAHTMTATLGRLGVLNDTGANGSASGITKRFAADFEVALDTMRATASAAGDFLTQAQAYKSLILMAVTAIREAQAALNTVNFGGGGLPSPQAAGQGLGDGITKGIKKSLDIHSPSQVMAAIGKDVVDGLVQGMSDAQQDAAKKAADVASAVAKAITDTLGAATALGKLDLTTLPGAGQITGILAFTRALVAEMAASSTILNEDGIKQTSAFADAAGKVASAVSASVASLTSLVTYVAPASRAIFDFGKSLRTAVADLAALADELGVALAEKAATFSEQATKAIAIFGSVSGFTALVGYVRPASKAIYDFGKDLMLAVGDLAAIVDLVGQELADKAGKFGEVASKAVGVIGGGAEAFTKLKDYARIPSKAIYDFGKDLMALIADFAAIVDLIGTEAAGKAALFASGALKVIEVIGKGVAAFATLDDWKAPTQAALDSFLRTIGLTLRGIADAAKGMTTDGLKAAGDFADAGTKAAGLLGAGVAGIANLASFVAPPRAVVDALLATIQYAIGRFGEMARLVGSEGTKQAGEFGTATQAVLGGIKAAVDTFILLDQATVPKTGDLSDLVLAVQGTMQNVAAAAKLLGSDTIKQAQDFGNAAKGIFDALKAGLDLFIQIDKPGGWPVTDWLQPLVELMRGALGRGAELLSQAQQLRGIAESFAATVGVANAGFSVGGAMLAGGVAMAPGGLGGGSGVIGGGGTTIINYYISGNTLLTKDSATQQLVSGIVTTQQNRTIGYATSG